MIVGRGPVVHELNPMKPSNTDEHLCRARTRAGKPCQRSKVRGGSRCRLHLGHGTRKRSASSGGRECGLSARSLHECNQPASTLTRYPHFLLWAKELISLADFAASGGRARERTCSKKP